MTQNKLSREALVVTNSRAGKGMALHNAAIMERDFGYDQVDLLRFLAYSTEISSLYSFLIVLGGDGTQASVVRSLLAQENLPQTPSVLLPGIGGEKVFARSLGLKGNPMDKLRDVLAGKYQTREVRPLEMNYQRDGARNTINVAWSVIGGASNLILNEIESMRDNGMSDFQRRMSGVLAGIQQLREIPRYVYTTMPDGSEVRSLDAGVTSGTIPDWTSHYHFGTGMPAILHLVGAGLDIEKDFRIIWRGLILDFVTNYFRIKRKNPIIDYKRLEYGERVSIIAEAGVSHDSEGTDDVFEASVRIAPEGSYQPVNLIAGR